jgi:hypothetical protein
LATAQILDGRAVARTRNSAVDFFRGLGLWIVFIDHIDPNVWSRYMLGGIGFSDFAEIFVFLSGFVGVGSYACALARGDVRGCVSKLVRRMGRLYGAHLLSFSTGLLLLAVFAQRGLWLNEPSLYSWTQQPEHYAWLALSLRYAPHLFSLLPLYIVSAPILLLATIGLRRIPALTVSISAGLWLISQIPFVDAHMLHPGGYFRPLAWQFLFVLGACARMHSERFSKLARAPRVIWAAAAVLVASAGWKILLSVPHDAGKATLAPYRLIHFLALAAVVYALMKHNGKWLQSSMARLAMACGADSLFIYSCTLVMDIGANLILAAFHGQAPMQLELSLCGLAMVSALAWARAGKAQTPLAHAQGSDLGSLTLPVSGLPVYAGPSPAMARRPRFRRGRSRSS